MLPVSRPTHTAPPFGFTSNYSTLSRDLHSWHERSRACELSVGTAFLGWHQPSDQRPIARRCPNKWKSTARKGNTSLYRQLRVNLHPDTRVVGCAGFVLHASERWSRNDWEFQFTCRVLRAVALLLRPVPGCSKSALTVPSWDLRYSRHRTSWT